MVTTFPSSQLYDGLDYSPNEVALIHKRAVVVVSSEAYHMKVVVVVEGTGIAVDMETAVAH